MIRLESGFILLILGVGPITVGIDLGKRAITEIELVDVHLRTLRAGGAGKSFPYRIFDFKKNHPQVGTCAKIFIPR